MSSKLNKGEIYAKEPQNSTSEEDLNYIFSDKKRFQEFRVLDTPIIKELESFFEDIEKETNNRNIIFDLQKEKCAKFINIILIILLVIVFGLCLTWIIVEDVDYVEIFSNSIYMAILAYYIAIPATLKISDSLINSQIV